MIRPLGIATLALAPILPGQGGDHPADPVQPPIPPIELGEELPAPASGALERDGHVADRFTAEGQVVRYALEVEADELSVLDVGTWGYSRGWRCKAGMRILDPDGKELVARERSGGTTSRLFEAFVAPRAGTYTLELTALEQYYRYTVVRHSSYRRRAPDTARRVGKAKIVHGYLADAADRTRFRVPVEAGRPLSVRVRPTHPQAETLARQARQSRPMAVVTGEPLIPETTSREARESVDARVRRDVRRAQGMAFPTLALAVLDPSGAEIAGGSHVHLWTPQEDGFVEVEVRATEGDGGALFRLQVDRRVKFVPVAGYVGDRDDDPVDGAVLHFLLDTETDHVATATTGPEGTWSADLVPGRYTILVTRGAGPVETVKVAVGADEGQEINTIYPH